MRYLLALFIAGVLIGGISLFVNSAKNSLIQRLRQQSDRTTQSDEVPPNADPNRETSDGANMEVMEFEILYINLLDLWINFRLLFIPIIIFSSLAIVRSTERPAPTPAPETARQPQS